LIYKVHEISLDQQSSQLSVQTLVLKSKFLLLDGDLITASDLLKQAQIITEEKGLYQLHTRVLEQQESFQAELGQWSDLITRIAPLQERIEHARQKDYLSRAIEIQADYLDKRLEVPKS